MKLKRLRRWIRGWDSFPYKMILFPTYRCNLNCPYCPHSAARKSHNFDSSKELSKEEWMKIVKEGKEKGVGEWRIFGGGEPMMRPEVAVGILKVVKKERIDRENRDCEIITNGTLFTEEIVEELVKYRLNRIIFSIDGPSAEIHDSLRNSKGAFDRVKKTMNLFKKMKRKYGQYKPWVKVNMVINKKNYNKIEEMVTLMDSLGCLELAIHPMRNYGSKNNSLTLNNIEEKKFKKSLENAIKLASEKNIELNISTLKEEKKEKDNQKRNSKSLKTKKIGDDEIKKKNFLSAYCFEPFYTIFIDPEGNTAPCNGRGKGNKKYNITKLDLEEIWFSDYFNLFRRKMLERKPMECCLKCGRPDMAEKLRKKLSKFLND